MCPRDHTGQWQYPLCNSSHVVLGMASISSMDCYLLLGDIQRPKRALSVSLSSCLSVCWSLWEETGGRVLQRCLRHCSPCSQLHGMGLCTCSLMAALASTIQRGSKGIKEDCMRFFESSGRGGVRSEVRRWLDGQGLPWLEIRSNKLLAVLYLFILLSSWSSSETS
jgi:hypothetical protein